MLQIKFPEHHYIHSSASTSDSDDDLNCKYVDFAKNKKLKNELCRNFLNTGFCRYYDKCQFAHGIEQLRQSSKCNLKYKTKQCQSYFVKGCCQYGKRCNFLHSKKDEDAQSEEKLKEMKNNFTQILEPTPQTSRLLKILKQ